jgi:hypothetical protein
VAPLRASRDRSLQGVDSSPQLRNADCFLQGFEGLPGQPGRPGGRPIELEIPSHMQMDVQVTTVATPSCGPCGCGQPCAQQATAGCTSCQKQQNSAGQQLATTGKYATKQDLEAAVKKIEQAETQDAHSKASKDAGAQEDPQARTQATAWPNCVDSGTWRGPYGDACTAYEHGGDRAFWCKWDGADAVHACPRACGTCGMYWKADDENQMLAQESLKAKGQCARSPAVRPQMCDVASACRQCGPLESGPMCTCMHMSACTLINLYSRICSTKTQNSVHVSIRLARSLMSAYEHTKCMTAKDAHEARPHQHIPWNICKMLTYAKKCMDLVQGPAISSERWPR